MPSPRPTLLPLRLLLGSLSLLRQFTAFLFFLCTLLSLSLALLPHLQPLSLIQTQMQESSGTGFLLPAYRLSIYHNQIHFIDYGHHKYLYFYRVLALTMDPTVEGSPSEFPNGIRDRLNRSFHDRSYNDVDEHNALVFSLWWIILISADLTLLFYGPGKCLRSLRQLFARAAPSPLRLTARGVLRSLLWFTLLLLFFSLALTVRSFCATDHCRAVFLDDIETAGESSDYDGPRAELGNAGLYLEYHRSFFAPAVALGSQDWPYALALFSNEPAYPDASGHDFVLQKWGFAYASDEPGPGGPTGKSRILLFPLPVLSALLAIPLVIAAYRRHVKTSRIQSNLCPRCGYDLRAHAPRARCPECGHARTALAPPAPQAE